MPASVFPAELLEPLWRFPSQLLWNKSYNNTFEALEKKDTQQL